MELSVFGAFVVFLISGVQEPEVTEKVHIFAFPYFNENLYLMMGMSGVFGALRLIGAIGLLRNRLWGLALSLTTSSVTLGLMFFLLPAGILDGVLTGGALVLMLTGWLRARGITGFPSRSGG